MPESSADAMPRRWWAKGRHRTGKLGHHPIPGSVFMYSTAVLRWNVLAAATIAFVLVVVAIQAGKLVVRPFEIAFREGISTVRDLAYVVVAQNVELFGAERATWTNDETWSLLSSVIREQTGMTQFTKVSRFVEDLKID